MAQGVKNLLQWPGLLWRFRFDPWPSVTLECKGEFLPLAYFIFYWVQITRNLYYASILYFSEIRRRKNVGIKMRGYEKECCENAGT